MKAVSDVTVEVKSEHFWPLILDLSIYSFFLIINTLLVHLSSPHPEIFGLKAVAGAGFACVEAVKAGNLSCQTVVLGLNLLQLFLRVCAAAARFCVVDTL